MLCFDLYIIIFVKKSIMNYKYLLVNLQQSLRKSLLLIVLVLLLFVGTSPVLRSQTIFSENFDGPWTTASTLTPAWSTLSTGNCEWHMNSYTSGWTFSTSGAYSPTGANSTSQSARFHSVACPYGGNGDLVTPSLDFSSFNGSKILSFYMINSSGGDNVKVYLSTDNGNTYGPSLETFLNYSSWNLLNVTLGNVNSSTVKIKFVATSDYGSTDIGIDQVSIENSISPPTIVTSGTPSALVSCSGYASLSPSSFSISAYGLTTDLTISAPTGFEVATSSFGPYSASFSITPTSGSIPTTTIYMRLTTSATGSPSGNVTCSSTGATAQNVAVSGTVNNTVTASVAIGSNDADNAICAGTSVSFSATPTNGGSTPSYQWKVDGVNVGTNSVTYTTSALTNAQTITCHLTSNETCVSGSPATSNTLTISVNLLPTVSLASFSDVCDTLGLIQLTGGAPVGGTYSGTGVTGNLFDAGIGSGSYLISYNYSDINGCSSTATNFLTVLNCSGAGINSLVDSDIKVYPNPSLKDVNIEIPSSLIGSKMTILDCSGRIMSEHLLTSNKTVIELYELEKGMYNVRIFGHNKSVRLIKL